MLLAGELEGEFVTGAGLVQEAEIAQMLLVTALLPPADGNVGEVCAQFTEVLADGGIREAIVEHLVYLVADGFGEAGDGAAAAFGIFDF